MIRIAAVYPKSNGTRFDLPYYINQHLPLVQKRFARYGLVKIEVDEGLQAPGGGESP